jgi:hypothetical protein
MSVTYDLRFEGFTNMLEACEVGMSTWNASYDSPETVFIKNMESFSQVPCR